MSQLGNGNGSHSNGSHGNGNGQIHADALGMSHHKVLMPALVGVRANESLVGFLSADGSKLQGRPTSFTRLAAVFEVYGGEAVLRSSEVIEHFEMCIHGQLLYAGKAVVNNLVNVNTKVICEVTLAEPNWQVEEDVLHALSEPGKIREVFQGFLTDRQKFSNVSGEFKAAVTDMETLLHDLRLWLSKISASIELEPENKRRELERNFLANVCEPAIHSLAAQFNKFERLAAAVDPSSRLNHNLYAKQVLHPLLLCSPFVHRTYTKPLGYAGDYEMVLMMTDDPFRGNSLYAKVLNNFFLNTPPVVAHRNRIDTLVKHLSAETLRVRGRRAKILNLGCGPAMEIQRFLRDSAWSDAVDFTLLDFNDETVAYANKTLSRIRDENGRRSTLTVLKKSVAQLVANSAKFAPGSFDLVYCAGLFDYLPDNICTRLLEVFYQFAAPGGLVLVSNVDACNPSRESMELIMDWLLLNRDARQMAELTPVGIAAEDVRIFSEPSSVNIFAEIRKPENG